MDLEKYINSLDISKLNISGKITKLEIIKLSEGFMNHNYKVIINGNKFLFRLGKFSDGLYLGKLDFEFHLLNDLKDYHITAKHYYYDKENGLLIEEFIDGNQEFVFNEKVNQNLSNLIKKLHTFPTNISYLEKIDSISKYKEKYLLWLKDNSNPDLIYLHNKLLEIINNYSNKFTCEFTLSHNDLRLDNLIFKDEVPFLIDLEGMSYADKMVDIASHYSGNLFFERFGKDYVFSLQDYLDWIYLFSKDEKFILKAKFYLVLQFFSDLCWLGNYLKTNNTQDLEKLFNKNIKIFKKNIIILL